MVDTADAMNGTRIEIIGVYRVPLAATEWARTGKPEGPHSQDFEHLWLVEIRIENSEGKLDLVNFTQADPGLPEDEWQVAYDETYLDSEGVRRRDANSGSSQRIAFFFHYLDLSRPLRTPYGEIRLPEPQPFPVRLLSVVKYISPC